MRPVFSLSFCADLILACILCGFTQLRAQDAGGFKFLEVKVVDPDGKPMADVLVEINIDEMKMPMPTDSDGKVAVNVPIADKTDLEIRVKHEGYAAMGVAWRGGKELPNEVTIPLANGVTFGGIVNDEHGLPVKGVEVSLRHMAVGVRHGLPRDGAVSPYLDGELAKTDEDGRWRCSMAPEADSVKMQLHFSCTDYLDSSFQELGTWQELKDLNKIAVLKKGITLRGVLLGQMGQPMEGVRLEIVVMDEGGVTTWVLRTNEKGQFRSPQIPKGPAIITVELPSDAPLQMPINVEPGIEPLKLKLKKGRPIQIQVVNKSGDTIANANVSIDDWLYPRHRLDVGENYNANAQGIWRWENAPEGELTYKISAPGYREAKHQLAASEEMQTVTLKPAIKVTGSVIDKKTREPIINIKLMGVTTIDCGLNQKCAIAFNLVEQNGSSDYEFQAGLLCDEFRITCSAEGYKDGVSRTITSDENELQWDFELERKGKVRP